MSTERALTHMLPNTGSLPNAKSTYVIPHPRCLLFLNQPPLRIPVFSILAKNLLVLLRNAATGTEDSSARPPAATDFGAAFRNDSRNRVAKQGMDAESFADDGSKVREYRSFSVADCRRNCSTSRSFVEFVLQAPKRRRISGKVVEDGSNCDRDCIIPRNPIRVSKSSSLCFENGKAEHTLPRSTPVLRLLSSSLLSSLFRRRLATSYLPYLVAFFVGSLSPSTDSSQFPCPWSSLP